MKIPIRPLLFVILTLLATIMAGFGLNLLDQIVHVKLYSYGLQFDYEWAYPYWIILNIILILLGLIATLTLSSIIYRHKKHKAALTPTKLRLFTASILVTTVAVTYGLALLDQIVHVKLYSFGLQFSYDWANPYWTILRTIQSSLGIISALALTYTVYLSTRTLKPAIKLPKPPKLIGLLILSIGTAALISSVVYTSTILAFIGLGLTFWGALLLYIAPVQYVKKDLLDSSLISALSAIDTLMTELNYNRNGIYMPPATLKEIRGGAVFVPATDSAGIPSTEEMAEGKSILKNPDGLRLIPPGLDLANLLEAEMKTDFTKVDLTYLQNNLGKALIEDLEIVEDFEMEINNDRVHMKLTHPIYADLYKEEKLQNVCQRIGCPLCSAIALILTRTTGKPIIVEKIQFDKDKDTVEADYHIMEA